jgi:hypothetical protein
MSAFIDLSGERFGRLKIIEKQPESRIRIKWVCQCDCGNKAIVSGSALKSGNTRSCGCLKMEGGREGKITHGQSDSPTYKSWSDMKSRCSNPKRLDYSDYGGRGINVCDRWVDSFSLFLADMGFRPSGTTLDRLDVNGDYCPENCRWATAKQQQRNKRNTKHVIFRGGAKSLAEWAEVLHLPYDVIRYRLKAGWTPEEAFTIPVRDLEDFLTLDGVKKTKAQWCKEKGITQNALLGRLRRGWSVADALNTPVAAKKHERGLTLNGVTKSKSQWARDYGISDGVLLTRLKKGWSPEVALTTPMKERPESRLITHKGITLPLTDWAKQLGIKPVTLGSRLNSGWAIEDALSRKVQKRTQSNIP